MKKNVFLVCALALLYSCGPVAYDPEGSATFYVKNLRSTPVTIRAVTNQGTNSRTVEVTAQAQGTVKLMEDSGIGLNPHPEYSFTSLEALDQSNTVIYSQNPISNSEWEAVVNNPNKATYYHTDYTIQIP